MFSTTKITKERKRAITFHFNFQIRMEYLCKELSKLDSCSFSLKQSSQFYHLIFCFLLPTCFSYISQPQGSQPCTSKCQEIWGRWNFRKVWHHFQVRLQELTLIFIVKTVEAMQNSKSISTDTIPPPFSFYSSKLSRFEAGDCLLPSGKQVAVSVMSTTIYTQLKQSTLLQNYTENQVRK